MDKARAQSADRARNRARWTFVGIVLLFAVPLFVAIGLYAGGWRPLGRVNNGELVDPPRDVSGVTFEAIGVGDPPDTGLLTGVWSVVHVVEAGCGQSCQQELHETRQVRIALGKDADRVQRVLLVLAPSVPGAGGDLLADQPKLILAQPQGTAFADGVDSVWLVDPLGNVILRYPPGYEPRGLLKDIKRLLKLSKIG